MIFKSIIKGGIIMRKLIAAALATLLVISTAVVTLSFSAQEIYAEEHTDNSEKSMAVPDIIYTVLYTGEETNIDDMLNVINTENGKNLIKDVNYRLTYKDNVEVGTATVYIDGIGEYEGCHLTTTYNIVKDEKNHVKVSFNKYSVTLYKSQQVNLKAYVNGKASNDVEWKSSNNKIAKVSKTGKVTAVSKGEAVITAIYQNDKDSAAVCKIKVNNYSTKMYSKVHKIRTNDSYTFNNKLIKSYTQMKKLIDKYSKTDYDKSVMKKLKKYNKAYFKNKAVCIGTIRQPAGKVTSVESAKKVMKSNGKYTIKVKLVSKDISNATISKKKNSFDIVVEISQEAAGVSDKVEIK